MAMIFAAYVDERYLDAPLATPFLAGLAVAAVALAGKYGVQRWQAFKMQPATARMRKFYDGGFQPTMTKREAALILGVRDSHHNVCHKIRKVKLVFEKPFV
ncbi:hypothetical protein ACLOJK_027766 [Asimina triloba]